MEVRSRALSAISWSTFSSVGTSIIQLAQLAVLGRLLGAEEFGLVAMASVVLGVASAYADVGMSNAILTHREITTAQLSSLYWLNWGASLVIALLMLLAAPLIASAFGEPRTALLISWTAASVIVVPLGLQYQLLLQKDLRIKPLAIVEVLAACIGLCVAVVAAYGGLGALSIVFGGFTVALVKTLSLFGLGWRRWPIRLHFSLRDIRPYVVFGAYQVGERTVNFASKNLDKIFIGALLGAYSLGLYSVAYQFMQKPIQFIQPIVARVALPLFAAMSDELARLRRAYLLIVEGLAMLMFPVFTLIMVAADDLILLILGTKWIEAAPVLRLLAILGCLYGIGFIIGSLLLARRRADMAFWLNVWAVVVYGIAIMWGSRWGIVGVAAALVVAQIIGMLPMGAWMRWKVVAMTPGPFLKAFLPTVAGCGIAGLLSARALLYIGEHHPSLSETSRLIATSIILGTVYLVWIATFMRQPLTRLRGLYENRAR